MQMIVAITWVHWTAFVLAVLFFLALDLGVFHRKSHAVGFKEALAWTAMWFSVAMLFALGLYHMRGQEEALEFVTGYIVELSLSMDNVFVIALIFGYFRVPLIYQHRVLFWGIMGALVMRGIMIGAGAVLVRQFDWTLMVFGAFLVFTGIKMLFAKEEGVDPEKNMAIRLARKFLPISPDFDKQHFVTYVDNRRMFTPLVLVLVMVFIGAKMLLPKSMHIATSLSLGIVGAIILISILASLAASWIELYQAKNRKNKPVT